MRSSRLAVLLIGAVVGQAVQAQTIRGTVMLPDSSRAAGAIVVATGAGGAEPARALTNATGEYSLRLAGAGRYTLTVLRIGFHPTPLPPVDVGANETLTRSIVLRADPVLLTQVKVTEAGGECRVKPDSGLAVADAWNEARQALLATQLATTDAPLVVDQVDYSRTLDASGRFVHKQTVRSSQSPTHNAYVSLPPLVLAAEGYTTETSDGTAYIAPDATVLLSESFAETHCLRIVPSVAGRERLVGVGFEPTQTRAGIRDIAGTFWVDRTTGELRSLDFHYTNLPEVAQSVDATGNVEFLRLPDGEWLVGRWRIHIPVIGVAPSSSRLGGGFLSVRAVQETGGEVDRVTRRDATLYRAVGDSLAVQLVSDEALVKTAGATLTLAGTDYTAKADARGLVALTPVLEGEYTARVSSALMDSLGLNAVEHTIDVRLPTHLDSIALPKARDAIRTVCPADSLKFGGGLMRGTVRDEHGKALKQVAVTVEWQDAVTAKTSGVAWNNRLRGVLTDDAGGWQMCGVPTNWNLVVKVVGDAGTDGKSIVVDAGRPFATVDLIASRAAGAADAGVTATRALVELAVVDPTGMPLSGATIDVSSEGTTHTTVTGVGGRALMPDLPPGQLRVRVKRVGFTAGEVAATVAAGRNTVPIVLSPTKMPALDTVRVVGGTPTRDSRDGFDTRRLQGLGTYVTAEDLAKHPTPVLADILARIRDVHVEYGTVAGPDRSGVPVPYLRGTSAAYCYPNVYVDGVLQVSIKTAPEYVKGKAAASSVVDRNDIISQFADLALSIQTANITGIEVYSTSGKIPAQFDRTSWNGCGSIVIWTR